MSARRRALPLARARVAPEKEAGESSHGSGSEANLLRGKYDSFQDRNGAGSDAAGKGEDKASVSARTLDAELGLRDDPVGAGSFTERQGKSAQRETEEEALQVRAGKRHVRQARPSGPSAVRLTRVPVPPLHHPAANRSHCIRARSR